MKVGNRRGRVVGGACTSLGWMCLVRLEMSVDELDRRVGLRMLSSPARSRKDTEDLELIMQHSVYL